MLCFLCSALSFANDESKKIILCGHPDYPPVSWVEGDAIKGLAPDVVKRVFRRFDYEIDAKVVGNWKRCLRELELGRVDVAVAYRTIEREQLFDFSREPVIDDPMAIFVNRNRSFPFTSWDDLLGKTAGLMLGDSMGNEFDQFMAEGLVVERVSEGVQNFNKLARAHIDFIPYGLHTGNLLVQRFGLEERVMPLPTLVTTNQYYLAISKHSHLTQYMDLIDAEIKRLRETKEMQRLTEYSIQAYSSKLRDETHTTEQQ